MAVIDDGNKHFTASLEFFFKSLTLAMLNRSNFSAIFLRTIVGLFVLFKNALAYYEIEP